MRIIIYKLTVVVQHHILGVRIDSGSRDVNVLVAFFSSGLLADVIVHDFGTKADSVETDTSALQIVAHFVRIGQRRINGIDTAVLNIVNHGKAVVGQYFTSHLVRIATDFITIAEAAKVTVGETVNVDTLAGCTFVEFEQTTLAERCIEFHNWDTQLVGVATHITVFVVVDNQLVCRNLHGKNVVGNPLIQQVAGILIIILVALVCIKVTFCILLVVQNPLAQFGQQLGVAGINALAAPECVGLCKDGKTILAVLGCIADTSFSETIAGHTDKVGNLSTLVQLLIHLITHFGQSIHQTAGLDYAGCHQIAFNLLVQDVLQIIGSGYVAGGNYLMDTVNKAVDGGDVTVDDINGTVIINIYTVGTIIHIVHRQLAVQKVSDGQFGVILHGKVCGFKQLGHLIATVNDTVEDDNLAY